MAGRGRRTVSWVATVVAAALVVSWLPASRLAAAPRAGTPSEWDPRIRAVAEKVEVLRDLKFEHPVAVRFLSDAEFTKRQRTDRSALSKDDEQELRRTEAQLRALGLIEQQVDLFDAANDIRSSDVLAYYDPRTKRITVKGDGPLDAASNVTLAHELTHALQDQHFNLHRINRLGAKHHASSATRALVEGDAVRIQNLYRQGLPKDQQEAATAQESDGTNSAAQDVPDMLLAIFEAPYVFGPSMVQAGATRAGGVDGLFRNPPTTESAFLTPSTLIDGVHVKAVKRPTVSGSEKVLGKPDVFGAFGLFLVLGSRLGPQTALDVADGWDGDSMVSLSRAGHTCVRAAFVGRDADKTAAIGRSLSDWAAMMAKGAVTVEARADKITLTACDVGAAAPAATHGADELLAFAAVRDMIYAGLVAQGQSSAVATCTGDGVVRDASFAPLLAAPDVEPDASVLDALRPRAQAIARECANVSSR
jgi:hypothetical protein